MTTFARGTEEYLKADVTDTEALTAEDAALSGPVEMSVGDRGSWQNAEWASEVFMKPIKEASGDAVERPTRKARILLNTADMPKRTYDVWVRLTEAPEIPILSAGTLSLI